MWRVLYRDIKTGTTLGELPASSFQYSDSLNAAGSFNVSMPLLDAPSATDFTPGRTMLIFERDGSAVWSGVLWGVQANIGSNSLTASGSGWLGYLSRRLITADATYTSTEQFTIARNLIATAQAATGGNVGLYTSGTSTSGVTRTAEFKGDDYRTVADALLDLSALDNGFDFYFDPSYVSGALRVAFEPLYPTSGRSTAHVLEVGTNINIDSYAEDGSVVANSVVALGGGSGTDRPTATSADAGSLASLPLLESTVTHSDETDATTLAGYAAARLGKVTAPICSIGATLYHESDPTVAELVVGDLVTVRGSYGYVAVDGQFRITAITAGVGVEGTEQVGLSLVDSGTFG